MQDDGCCGVVVEDVEVEEEDGVRLVKGRVLGAEDWEGLRVCYCWVRGCMGRGQVVGRGYTEYLEGVAGLDPWGVGVVEMEGLGIVWKGVDDLCSD